MNRIAAVVLASYLASCVVATGQSGIITTAAGSGAAGFSGDGGPAPLAKLVVAGIALDASGNLFFTDTLTNRIRKVSANGIITTVAGNGTSGFSGDGGPATSASLNTPYSVAVDASGNLFIGDFGNNRIRKVSAAGIITTVAGIGPTCPFAAACGGFSGDGGPATSAALNEPLAVTVDASGNLFIAEEKNQRVRKVAANGTITTVAGNGMEGFSGDGGPAVSAALDDPSGIAVDASGNLFIVDSVNSRIRKVSPSGTITTVAGSGATGGGFSGDGGPATSALMGFPDAVAIDAAGNLFIADRYNSRIRKASAAGIITTFAGGFHGYSGDGGPATSAQLGYPTGVAVDGSGNVFIADGDNNRIREVLAQIPGSTGANAPSLSAGSIFNASLNSDALPASPGGLITIFGTNLSSTSASAGVDSSGRIPLTLAGTSVQFGSISVPLLYVSPTQINAQVPFEAAPRTYTVIVTTASGHSNSINLTVAATSPGMFAGAVLNNSTGALIDATNPARPGEVIVIYCTGLGAVSPGAVTGQLASGNPVSFTAAAPTASIAGLPVLVANAVLSPGFVGLYQIGIVVPDGLPAGAQPVLITIGGATAQPMQMVFAPSSNPQYCADVSGVWNVMQSGMVTETIAAAIENDNFTDPFSNQGIITIAQKGCSITYAPTPIPGLVSAGQAAALMRTGTVTGNTVSLQGLLTTAALAVSSQPGLTIAQVTQNQFQASGHVTGAVLRTTDSGNFAGSGTYSVGGQNGTFTLSYALTGNTTLVRPGVGPISPGSIIATVAGDGFPGFAGDGGPATSAMFADPLNVAVDSSGNLYIADEYNQRIRKVSSSGIITTIAGNGTSGFSGDGGPATAASITTGGIAVDGSGNLYLTDLVTNRVRKVSSSGIITTVAGNSKGAFSGDGGPATAASLFTPVGVAVDSSGNLYIADSSNNRVRKVSASGIITTIAGTGAAGSSGDGGPATSSTNRGPQGIAVDAAGNIYFSDTTSNRIRKVSAAGIITTVAGNGASNSQTGQGAFGGDGGPATSASLNFPQAVAVDSSGNLFIADYNNQRVRKVSAGGIITTAAGTGAAAYSGDGGPPTLASLNHPSGVAVDASGNLFIADFGNQRIREVLMLTSTTTSSGNSPSLGRVTGVLAGSSAFATPPHGMSVASDNQKLYILGEPPAQ